MIDLYYWPTPNGHKATIALEEMGLAYTVKPVNILGGEQHTPEFAVLSPNTRIPAIVDHDGPGGAPHSVFESGAILMYLAEKSGRFWPSDAAARSDVIQWLFFQCANVGPMFGQCGHFRGYAPEKIDYGINRYCGETVKLYGVMDRMLGTRAYLAGADYSLATYPWCAPKIRDLHAIDIDQFPNVKRWTAAIENRLAVQRGMAVMGDVMKIGNPDETARAALFGKP
jgi:GSH-dependent disulfide-bond oxidoreductase